MNKDFKLLPKDILLHHLYGLRAHNQAIAGQMICGNASNLHKIALAFWLPSYRVGDVSQRPAYFLQSN